MASLQGSLLVATSILEGAVNACSNAGTTNVESATSVGAEAVQTLRPLSLISEVQQMMQSQQVCYQAAVGAGGRAGGGGLSRDDLDDDVTDEGHHSAEGHDERPHSQV